MFHICNYFCIWVDVDVYTNPHRDCQTHIDSCFWRRGQVLCFQAGRWFKCQQRAAAHCSIIVVPSTNSTCPYYYHIICWFLWNMLCSVPNVIPICATPLDKSLTRGYNSRNNLSEESSTWLNKGRIPDIRHRAVVFPPAAPGHRRMRRWRGRGGGWGQHTVYKYLAETPHRPTNKSSIGSQMLNQPSVLSLSLSLESTVAKPQNVLLQK